MEFLIWLNDKPKAADAPTTGIDSYKAGDVIIACPDGWGWTQAELINPDWCVIKCPDVFATLVDALQSHGDGDHMTQLLHKRKFNLDLTHPSIAAQLRNRKGQPINVAGAVMSAATVQKAAPAMAKSV